MRQVDNKTKVKKMNDIVHYDAFQKGDRVWSEAWGFGEIIEEDGHNESVLFKSSPRSGAWITCEGSLATARTRPRTIFHAVADTDDGMREAIARGEGLRRPVRGRWPICPGDRVLIINTASSELCKEYTASSMEMEGFALVNGEWYLSDGRYNERQKFPTAIRLYPDEKLPSSKAEALMLFGKAMIEERWEQRYGQRK